MNYMMDIIEENVKSKITIILKHAIDSRGMYSSCSSSFTTGTKTWIDNDSVKHNRLTIVESYDDNRLVLNIKDRREKTRLGSDNRFSIVNETIYIPWDSIAYIRVTEEP